MLTVVLARAFVIGIRLGLIGGGGSILMVPGCCMSYGWSRSPRWLRPKRSGATTMPAKII